MPVNPRCLGQKSDLSHNPQPHRRRAPVDAHPQYDTWRNEKRRFHAVLGVTEQSPAAFDNVHEYVRLRSTVGQTGPTGSKRRNRVLRVLQNELSFVCSTDLGQ